MFLTNHWFTTPFNTTVWRPEAAKMRRVVCRRSFHPRAPSHLAGPPDFHGLKSGTIAINHINHKISGKFTLKTSKFEGAMICL